jgi:hypothetical protein
LGRKNNKHSGYCDYFSSHQSYSLKRRSAIQAGRWIPDQVRHDASAD